MPKTVIERLSELSPRSFENFVYDLLVRRGLTNVTWRTPGADGGRDIEGVYGVTDFSGTSSIQRWYVECKRYAAAVDWPTVYEKLSYAANHQADFLLFCTTSTMSPRCRDEINRREAAGLMPHVRAWEGHNLEALVLGDDPLVLKYRLADPLPKGDSSALPLLWIAAKGIQDAYGRSVVGVAPDKALAFSAAIAELAAVSAEDWRDNPRPQHRFLAERDLYDWCVAEDVIGLERFDGYGLRAMLCVARLAGGDPVRLSTVQQAPQHLPAGIAAIVRLSPAPDRESPAIRQAFDAVAMVSNFEWRINAGAIQISMRE